MRVLEDVNDGNGDADGQAEAALVWKCFWTEACNRRSLNRKNSPGFNSMLTAWLAS